MANIETASGQLNRRGALSEPIGVYERMLEIRFVEGQIQTLFEDGHMRGSTHLCIGQEAVSVGIAQVTRVTDMVSCTYRGHGMALALGVEPEAVFGEMTGRAIGCAGGLGGSMHLSGEQVGLLPTFAIVGAGIPIAVGAALAAQIRGTDGAAVAVFGDGATNIGAFHESLNLASIWKLPVVFVCENNLYGEYTAIQLTTPLQDLARRADSYAMPGMVVDGQDVDAVADAVAAALVRARIGLGPTLLEMKTYRYSGHSRSDDAKYRPAGELAQWTDRDPIELYASVLVERRIATAEKLITLRAEVLRRVERAAQVALSSAEPDIDEMFRHVLAGSSQVLDENVRGSGSCDIG